MSADHGLQRDGDPKPSKMPRMAYFFGVVFAGTLLIGILATIAFSASGCLLSPVIRCFSIARDTASVMFLGFKMWSLPALIAALLIAAIVRIRGEVIWWNVLLVAPASYLVLALLSIRQIDQYMLPELLVQSVLLFICVQLSLFVGRMAYRVQA